MWDDHLKPCTFTRSSGLRDGDRSYLKYFRYQVQTITCVLSVPVTKYHLLLVIRYPNTIILP